MLVSLKTANLTGFITGPHLQKLSSIKVVHDLIKDFEMPTPLRSTQAKKIGFDFKIALFGLCYYI